MMYEQIVFWLIAAPVLSGIFISFIFALIG